MKLGYVGLGKMGMNMVLHLLDQGVGVVVWNRSEGPREELRAEAPEAEVTVDLGDLVSRLDSPRVVWLMLTAGEATDEVLNNLTPLLSEGDLIIDGGNSFYKDSIRRGEELNKKGIHFMDIGTSGGPNGARNGACLMVGGSNEDYQKVEELLIKIAAPQSLAHLGKVGAGHFAKMVHNGIEYGMMEAIAEGADVLKKSGFGFNLAQVFNLYNHQSVIESRLVSWSKEAFEEDPNLSDISSKINQSGEAEWTVKTAKEEGIEVPVIEKSLQERIDSSEDKESFKNKVVNAQRNKFGGHKVSK